MEDRVVPTVLLPGYTETLRAGGITLSTGGHLNRRRDGDDLLR